MAEVGSAFVTILPSMSGFSSKLNAGIGPQLDSTAKKSGSRFGKLFASTTMGPLRALGGAALGYAAFSALKNGISGAVEEAREAEKVGARTENVIKSMGLSSKVTADQIGALAMSISNKSAVDDEAVQNGQNLLLTFGNVAKSAGQANGVFAQSSQLMVDMSAAMGTDMKGSAIQLGKALNDPIKGVSALTRVGVSFSEQQKAQIARFVESGNLAKAQGVILGEVSKQFGGAAAAMASPADRLKVSWANFQEQIGTMLLPIVDRLITTITSTVLPAMSTFFTQMQTGTGAGGQLATVLSTVWTVLRNVTSAIVSNLDILGPLAAGVLAVVGAVKAWRVAQTLLNLALTANPLGLIVAGIAALAAGAVIAYKKSDTFRGIVDKLWAAIKVAAGWVANIAGKVVSFGAAVLGQVIPPVTRFASFLGGALASAISTVIGWVVKIVGKVIDFGKAILDRVKDVAEFVGSLKDKFGDAVDFVKGIPGKIKDALGNLGNLLLDAGKAVMQGLLDGIEAGWRWVEDKLSWITDKIPDWKGPAEKDATLLRPAGQLIMKGLVDGIGDGMGALREKLKAATDAIKTQLDQVRSDFASLRDSVASAFTGNLFEAETASDFMSNLLDTKGQLKSLKKAFRKLVAWGLKPNFLAQLFQSGNAGLILDLAAGGSTQAQEAAGLFGDVQSMSSSLGNQVASERLGPKLDGLRDELQALRRDVRKLSREFGQEINGVAAAAARAR